MRIVVTVCGALLAFHPMARAAEFRFCRETPTLERSTSVGAPSHGKLVGGVPIQERPSLEILPQVRPRCLIYGVERLVKALTAAADHVLAQYPGSPALRVGDLSRAGGGPIPAFSHSHQSGRDADLAFFQTDASGKPVPTEVLTRFGPDGRAIHGAVLRFDVARNWSLVAALVSDPSIGVRWLFISQGLRNLLLAHARRIQSDPVLVERVAGVLHQPSDAPPHDDHLHVRIRCTEEEVALGCRG